MTKTQLAGCPPSLASTADRLLTERSAKRMGLRPCNPGKEE